MYSDPLAEGWRRDLAETRSTVAELVRANKALEAEAARLRLECAVWRRRAEEAEAMRRAA